jgi:methyl-accepting chemotaxis protein
MTGFDVFFLVMAAIDLVALVLLTLVGMRMIATARQGQQRAAPAIREVRALAETGKALASHARKDGQIVLERVKAVSGKVKERVETTKRIASELRPSAKEAASNVQETAARAREKGERVQGTARSLGDMARRVGRIRSAAEAAADAARNAGA